MTQFRRRLPGPTPAQSRSRPNLPSHRRARGPQVRRSLTRRSTRARSPCGRRRAPAGRIVPFGSLKSTPGSFVARPAASSSHGCASAPSAMQSRRHAVGGQRCRKVDQHRFCRRRHAERDGSGVNTGFSPPCGATLAEFGSEQVSSSTKPRSGARQIGCEARDGGAAYDDRAGAELARHLDRLDRAQSEPRTRQPPAIPQRRGPRSRMTR